MRGGKRPGSGRKPGSMNQATIDVKMAAQAFTGDALETLASIMRNTEQPAAARVAAAGVLLDRGHGKSKQEVDVAVDGGLTIEVVQFGAGSDT